MLGAEKETLLKKITDDNKQLKESFSFIHVLQWRNKMSATKLWKMGKSKEFHNRSVTRSIYRGGLSVVQTGLLLYTLSSSHLLKKSNKSQFSAHTRPRPK